MTATYLVAQAQEVSGFDYLQTAALLLAAVGLGVTGIQVVRESRSAKQSRNAALSWSMYQAYVDSEIRHARGVAEFLAASPNCPRSPEEYLKQVADGSPWRQANAGRTDDGDIRRLARFYNQLAILLKKNLIDEDFVFALVGPGLISTWKMMEPALRFYQHFYAGPDGPQWHKEGRPIYGDVYELYQRCVRLDAATTHSTLDRVPTIVGPFVAPSTPHDGH